MYESGGHRLVEKKFHAKYTVDQEADIYKLLEPCTEKIAGLKLGNIIHVDRQSQALYMDFVPGPTLKELMARGGLKSLDKSYIEIIIELSLVAHSCALTLDADPSNFIVDDRDGYLTFIDPVIDAPGIKNSAVVIFLWGMIKYKVRFLYRILEIRRFCELWNEMIRKYSNETDQPASNLYRDLRMYVRLVIDWNINESSSDVYAKRIVRAVFLVPLWYSLYFMLGLIMPRK